jgi:L-threonylcarbamoyladenylate synthase
MITPGIRLIERAAELLHAGELVAFPTETVYGLGADAANREAVAKIFAAKGRPPDHPVIVHLASAAQVGQWAREFPEPARRLAAAFWPGPLTLVLARRAGVPDEVTGGQDTVALRVPSHPVARALLERFGGGIAAPSANRYGRVSPTQAAHVRDELGARVALVLDGGECDVGLESTIVSCVGDRPVLLRPGHITRAQIERVAGQLGAADELVPRVPGSKRSHYSPATLVELVDGTSLAARCTELSRSGVVAVLARRAAPAGVEAPLWRESPTGAAAFGHELYASLRALDQTGATRILVERVPEGEEWDAARDRLERAAASDPPDET